MFTPASILGMCFRLLFSVLLIAGGATLLALWYNHREQEVIERVEVPITREVPAKDATGEPRPRTETVDRVRTVVWEFGFNRETAFLLGGLAMLAWSVGGGWIASPRLRRRKGANEPHAVPGEVHRLRLADGSHLHVETYGLADGPPIICVHGWGLDNQEWCYFKTRFAPKHRIIAWDLPGLGRSERPVDRDWALEKLAQNLHAVMALAGDKPVILAGHSIGVMIILTYCRVYHSSLRVRVRGLILAQSTYKNPVTTMQGAALYTALQKPVLEPLCYLMIGLSPLVRVLNWLSYWNGSAHRSTEKESFSGNETRGQLDFMARYMLMMPPDVIARGMLAMFKYNATDILTRINVPTLIFAGDQDRTCLPEASEFMAGAIPGAKLVFLKPAKHCGLFEHHVEYHEAVDRFLRALEPAEAESVAASL